MFKRKMCSTCRIGRQTYIDDPSSSVCPYLDACSKGGYTFYEKYKRNNFFEKIRDLFKKNC